jgi:hypothetical protein
MMNSQDKGDQRPTLFDLWMAHQFRLETLAELTEQAIATIETIICGIPAPIAVAEKVLAQVSVLIDQECTLETVRVPLQEAQPVEQARKVVHLLAEFETLQVRTRQCVEDLSEIADVPTMVAVMQKLGEIRTWKACS